MWHVLDTRVLAMFVALFAFSFIPAYSAERIPGHGPMGTKADVRDHRGYLQTIYDEVLAAARAGMTLEQMKASIDLSKYSDWGQYEAWSPLNIEGVYRQIEMHRRGN